MKDPLIISTAQFENKSGDKEYNLSVIDQLSAEAAAKGSQVVAFHECSVTGYTFARHLSKEQLLDIAEPVPSGPSVKKLQKIAAQNNIAIIAGLFEREGDNIYKAQVCVDKNGLIAKFRKLHPFINRNIMPRNAYCVFDLYR